MRLGNIWALVVLTGFSAGCASHSAYLTARQNPDYSLAGAKTVVIAQHDKAIPEEVGLDVSLKTALEQGGFQVVTDADSEYTISYWVEDSWHEHQVSPGVQSATSPNYLFYSGQYDAQAQDKAMQQQVQEEAQDQYTKTRGIRLKLYRTQDLQAGRFDTVWEGYIDAGSKVRPNQQELLLKTLLQYLGHDFNGRVAFAK